VLRRPLESTQYACRRYRERVAAAGLLGSMSRAGNPYDNALAESFMKTLKHEEIYLRPYRTMGDAIAQPPRLAPRTNPRQR
jgi:transposase InsO family protein